MHTLLNTLPQILKKSTSEDTFHMDIRGKETKTSDDKEIYYTTEKKDEAFKTVTEINEPCNHKVHFEFRAL